MFHTRWLTVTLITALLLLGPRAAASEKADTLAKEAVEQFTTALAAKNIDGLMKVADVPWCQKGSLIIKDRDELRKYWQQVLDRRDFSKAKVKVKTVAALPKFEESLGKKLPKESRQKLEEVLGKEHRLVLLEVAQGERKHETVFAVRIQDGKAKVVGSIE
jgi:hypothetical protein